MDSASRPTVITFLITVLTTSILTTTIRLTDTTGDIIHSIRIMIITAGPIMGLMGVIVITIIHAPTTGIVTFIMADNVHKAIVGLIRLVGHRNAPAEIR